MIMMMFRYLLPILVLLSLGYGCQDKYNDSPEEDYAKLFPFKGIEKPEVDDALILKQCNPREELALSIYDPEADRPATGREYEVTINYSYRETATDGRLVESPSSRLLVRYLDEDGQYVLVGSSTLNEELKEVMENGREYSVTYKARSGQLLYIATDGLAPRGASIKVSATARSLDGLITIPPLGTHQFQNNEGIHLLPYPYCEYMLLP